MTAKRFTIDKKGGAFYLFDNGNLIPIYDGQPICDLLNELHKENLIKLEIVDAFIQGLEDEKGIDSENVEFQCRMNFTIKILKNLKKEMLDPTEFKRLKEL